MGGIVLMDVLAGFMTMIGVMVVVGLIVGFGIYLVLKLFCGWVPASSSTQDEVSDDEYNARREAKINARRQAEYTAKAMKRPDGRLTNGDIFDTDMRHR